MTHICLALLPVMPAAWARELLSTVPRKVSRRGLEHRQPPRGPPPKPARLLPCAGIGVAQ